MLDYCTFPRLISFLTSADVQLCREIIFQISIGTSKQGVYFLFLILPTSSRPISNIHTNALFPTTAIDYPAHSRLTWADHPRRALVFFNIAAVPSTVGCEENGEVAHLILPPALGPVRVLAAWQHCRKLR